MEFVRAFTSFSGTFMADVWRFLEGILGLRREWRREGMCMCEGWQEEMVRGKRRAYEYTK